jgi:ABC-2 type transport system permease protein
MNTAIIAQLIRKDWSLHRVPIALLFAAGLVSVLMLLGGQGTFYFGTVLLITAVIGHGIYLAFATVVHERSDGTLPFLMSLPVSVQEYTAAKLLGNMLMFLIPWGALVVGVAVVILTRDAIPDGLLPFSILLLVELLAGYVLVLGFAIVSESTAWTVGAMVFGNLFVQVFLYFVSRMPGIAATMSTERIVWSSAAITLLLVEMAVVALILLVTWRLQGRKTDFL